MAKIADALSPYVQTRQETLRIRRILTLFVAQSIENSHIKVPSPRSLAVPDDDTRVRHIPPEFTGVRKRYLHALQTHIKAREAYERQVRGPDEAEVKAIRQNERNARNGTSAAITIQLELLQEQRKYQRLKILQKYLDQLAKQEAAKSNHLSVESIAKAVLPLPELHSGTIAESEHTRSAKDLTLRLQKAVLRAKNNLEIERGQLERLKSNGSSEENSAKVGSKAPDRRVLALSQTRDELIYWIEQQLAKSTEQENEESRIQSSRTDKIPLNIARRRKDIEERYEEYLRARRSLISSLSKMYDPIMSTPIETQETSSSQRCEGDDTLHQEADLVLPYVIESFIPAADTHKTYLQQESYLAKILQSEINETDKVLSKMADESHLLSNHSSQAADLRFESLEYFAHNIYTESESEETRITQKAQAWASAVMAASTAKRIAVEERLDSGEAHISIARELIGELQEILGESRRVDEVEAEPRSVSQKSKTESQRKYPKNESGPDRLGIWAGLDGNIRIEDNKLGSIP